MRDSVKFSLTNCDKYTLALSAVSFPNELKMTLISKLIFHLSANPCDEEWIETVALKQSRCHCRVTEWV